MSGSATTVATSLPAYERMSKHTPTLPGVIAKGITVVVGWPAKWTGAPRPADVRHKRVHQALVVDKDLKDAESSHCPEDKAHRSPRSASRHASAGAGHCGDAPQPRVLVGESRNRQRDDTCLVAEVIGGGRTPSRDWHRHHEFARLLPAQVQDGGQRARTATRTRSLSLQRRRWATRAVASATVRLSSAGVADRWPVE